MKVKNKKATIVRSLCFAAAVVLIIYFLPRTNEHRYIYEVNRPWTYQLLTAPFDIPVYLDSISAKAVTDSLDADFVPVFRRNSELESTTIQQFAQNLNGASHLDITSAERNKVIDLVRKVYDDGIVDQQTYSAIASGKLPTVKFVHDNVAVSAPTTGYRSDRAAYAYIDSVFSGERFHEALSQVKLQEALVPTIGVDSVETERMHTELLRKAMAPRGVIQQGERIIDEGDVVTLQLYTVLQTYEELLREKNAGAESERYYPIAGQALFLIIMFGLLYVYLALFRPDYYRNTRKLTFIMLVITVMTLFAFALNATFDSGLYVYPATMVPIMILIFMDSRTALFCHLVTVLIVALVCLGPFEFIFLQVVAGTVAIESIKELTRRSQLIRAAFFIFLAYCLAYVAMRLVQLGSLSKIQVDVFGYFAMNAIIISFAYVLVFMLEKAFGFTSKVTLVELSDINNPLLRKLSEECPGTFQHSMAVSNLASSAASRIGANVQLVRTGALYHDIGKTANPAFFTENQHGVNPHDALDPRQSARIIIGHITEGMKMADKAKLPDVIKKFITEHHGRGTARYFYTSYCNAHPDEEVDVAAFQYPGPNPTSRETSLLMMADAVEASSRSLKDHTPEAITALVNRIIDTQIAEGLHQDSPLSFRDVKIIKESFINRLRTMYHSRIQYPDKK